MSFLVPAMVGWAALAAAAPLVIYLLFFRHATPVLWGAMEILRRAARKQRRRHQLQDIILIAVRAAALCAIGLALAQPVLRAAGALRETPYYALLALDTSASMGYRTDGATLFEGAVELAQRAAQRLPGRPLIGVLEVSAAPRLAEATPTDDRGRAQRLLATLQPTHIGDEPARVVQRIAETVAAHGPRRTRVFLLSDFQRGAWEPARETVTELLGELPPTVDFTLVPLQRPDTENLSLRGLEIRAEALAVDRPVEFAAAVAWQGEAPLEDVAVELVVDGESVSRRLVSFTPGKEETVVLRHVFSAPGLHEVAVRLPDDRLPADNERGVALRLAERVPLLLVNDAAEAGRVAAADYLAAALAPGEQADRRLRSVLTPWQVRRIDAAALAAERFETLGALVVADAGGLPRRALDTIRQAVDAGTGALLVSGQTLTREALAALGVTVESAEPYGATEGEESWGVRPVGAHHPLLRLLADGAFQRDLAGIRFAAGVRIAPASDSRAQVLLETTHGAPLLLETVLGRGRLFLLCARLDRADTNLPLHPTFVALLNRAVSLLVRHGEEPGIIETGSPWIAALSSDTLSGSPMVEFPDGRVADADPLIESSTGGAQLKVDGIAQRGFYRYRTERRGLPLRAVYAHCPAGESDPALMNAPELRAIFGPRLAEIVRPEDAAALGAAHPVEGASLYPWVLACGAALLALESVLASRFGAASQSRIRGRRAA